MHTPKRSVAGLSLLETILVIAAIGILAAVAIVRQGPSLEDVRVAKLQCDLATINTSLKTYVANGGSVAGLSNPQQIIDKMKTVRSEEDSASYVGFRGTAIDTRLAVRLMTDTESSRVRAVWNASASQFELQTTGTGVEAFYLDDALGRVAYGTEERSQSAFAFNTGNGWIWNYADAAPLSPPAPTDIPISPDPGGSGSGSGGGGGSLVDPVLTRLSPPVFSVPGGSYPPSQFSFPLTLSNPNPADSSRILYSVNGEEFQIYTGPVTIASDAVVAAFTTGDPYTWIPSATAEVSYVKAPPTQLTEPVVSPSAQQFAWGSTETITVTISNPNDSKVSSLEYQIDGSGWQAYSGPIELSVDDYANGVAVTARAVPANEDYAVSQTAIAAISPAADPEKLLAPTIRTSAPDFIIHQIETIQITLDDLNPKGSSLDYRINGGAWVSYNGPIEVTREAYETGLVIDARATATSRAYTGSDPTSATIGLTAVQLLPPSIGTSAPNFLAGSIDRITVTITDPNQEGSALQSRINGRDWQDYSGPFTVTRAANPTGLIVEARAKSVDPA
jgi:type II secretory pathway pseudopilin PulG